MLAKPLEISSLSMITPMADQISSELNGEVVILNLASGVYYGLDIVGSRIWGLIQQPCRVDHIQDVLLEEYDVTPEACQRQLIRLLQELRNADLIEVSNVVD